MSNEPSDSRKPVEKHSDGAVTASIWKNSGANGEFHTVTFERRYKDKDGNWQSSHSYTEDDLLHLEKLTDETRKRIKELDRDKSWAKTVAYGQERGAASGLTADDVPEVIAESRREQAARRR